MKHVSKDQYREYSYLNKEITDKVISVRRNQIQELNGKKPTKNISSKASIVLNSIFNMIIETGVNELMVSKTQLTKLMDTDRSNTNRDIKTYFRGYGLGEYGFSTKYNITVNGKRKDITKETHYYIYINKETLELMKSIINIEGVDFDRLIEQIPECENKCNIIGNKTETQINILNYVDDEFIMEHKIKVEKNLFTKEGHYSKETSIIKTEDNSVVEVSKKENDFIPKEKEDIFELHTEDKQEGETEMKLPERKPITLKGAQAFYNRQKELDDEVEEVEEEEETEEVVEEEPKKQKANSLNNIAKQGVVRRTARPQLRGGR